MIVVTGAAGFIGANLAHRLAADGYELLLIDHPLTPGNIANLVGIRQFRFIDHEGFLALLEREGAEFEGAPVEGVFHLGACSSTTETDWNYLSKNNVQYSQAIWNWCARHKTPLIYASSAATYGDGSAGFNDRTAAAQLRPLNLYGQSKNDFDAWVLSQLKDGNSAPRGWAGMKFFNVYGPYEAHKGKMASVVWHAHRMIQETGEVRLFRSNDPAIADGEQRRDFVFVRDCVEHMLWLWRHPEASGIYNSGTGMARTFMDLARAVFRALQRNPVIRFVDMPADLSKQYQNYTQADMSKMMAAGYSGAATTLEDGVLETVKFIDGQRRK